jgi:hypothetical protein
LKGNELRGSGKEGESKGEGSKRTIQVLRKGKEKAINVEGSNILRESIQEDRGEDVGSAGDVGQSERKGEGVGGVGDIFRLCIFLCFCRCVQNGSF